MTLKRSDCFFVGALFGAALFVAILVMASCDEHVHHDGTVNQLVTINISSVETYFRAKCEKDLAPTNPTEEQLKECSDVAVGDFLTFLEKLGSAG